MKNNLLNSSIVKIRKYIRIKEIAGIICILSIIGVFAFDILTNNGNLKYNDEIFNFQMSLLGLSIIAGIIWLYKENKEFSPKKY